MKATNKLDKDTQQNKAVFRQNAASVASLRAEASSLTEAVTAFCLDGSTTQDTGKHSLTDDRSAAAAEQYRRSG